ncbi:alpha-mannosidase 2C1-like [Penaeus indicus]|uniref:alpha-mannosidase 2C1-like n=1 Tax=Penaeus indicus TaxID=29960 RepID=UPI00300CF143
MDEEVTASLHKHRRTTLERLEKYISDTYFTDVNLRGKLYPFKKNISKISHWRVPGGEGSWQQWSFRQMLTQSFTPIKVGESFGPTWSTHWFKIEIAIPEAWKGQPVLFRWKSQSEAMIWSRSGEPLQTGDSTACNCFPRVFCACDLRPTGGRAGRALFTKGMVQFEFSC